MARGNEARPIVIKRVKKVAAGHHGGAWKVAYADFVTAMMAFFLLLWLLNATTEEQKKGISNFFAPNNVSDSRSGAGGVMGGRTFAEGAMPSMGGTPAVFLSVPPNPTEADREAEENSDAFDGSGENEEDDFEDEVMRSAAERSPEDAERRTRLRDDGSDRRDSRHRAQDMKIDATDPKDLARAAALEERRQFEAAAQELKQALETTPELKDFKQSLMIDQTSEGLRIQIVDQEKVAMFPLGGSQMYPQARELLRKVVLAVDRLPHKISVMGHTDAAQFVNDRGYSNWELSADRANASRRALVELGLPVERIARVGGLADMDPLVPAEPLSPRNRRISITLLRQMPQTAAVPNVPAGTEPTRQASAAGAAAPQGAGDQPATAVP